jgi:hypothetical protein
MKRVGYILVAVVALLTIFTLALAEIETRNGSYLSRPLPEDEAGPVAVRQSH